MELEKSEARRTDVFIQQGKLPQPYCEKNWKFPPNEAFPYNDVYKPLNQPDREIRLMRLLPGKSGGLKCEIIQNVPLPMLSQQQPQPLPQTTETYAYEALSYCAGDPNDYQPIQVNGYNMNAFSSLHSALQNLRDLDREKIFWIDQICINQKNVSERNRQVLRMKDIYRNAKDVPIWLGPREHQSDVAMSFLKDIFRERTTVGQGPDRLTALVERVACKISDPVLSDSWVSITRLLQRSWWQRCWVVQEALLARHAYFVCGPDIIDWKQSTQALNLIMKGVQETRVSWTSTSFIGQALIVAESYISSHFNAFVMSAIAAQKKVSLTTLLDVSRRLQASDPRDKIYSVLGLLDDDLLEGYGIVPDYAESNTADDVFLHAVKASIKVDNTLELLRNAFTDDRSSCLPSWVPDWRLWKKIYRIPQGFAASGRYAPSATFLRGGVLKVKALPIDGIPGCTLGEANKANPDKLQEVMPTFRSWMEIMRGACSGEYVSGGECLDAFYRTMLLDQDGDMTSGDEESSSSITSLPELEDALQSSIGKYIGTRTSHGRFFVSTRQYMGLAPQDACGGDKIYILLGASVPFVLRKQQQQQQQEQERDSGPCYHRLIGEAYVHGIMKGSCAREYCQGKRKAEDVYLY